MVSPQRDDVTPQVHKFWFIYCMCIVWPDENKFVFLQLKFLFRTQGRLLLFWQLLYVKGSQCDLCRTAWHWQTFPSCRMARELMQHEDLYTCRVFIYCIYRDIWYIHIFKYTYFEFQSLCLLHGRYQRETKHPVKTHDEGWIEGVKICQLRCEIGGEEILKAMDVADRNLFKKLLGRSLQ